jgi:hypothetical protein
MRAAVTFSKPVRHRKLTLDWRCTGVRNPVKITDMW